MSKQVRPDPSLLFRRAEQLAEAGTTSFPVRLRELVNPLNIGYLGFAPLPVPACLEIRGGKFHIFVNALQTEVSSLNATLMKDETLLPRRARFSIAHEMGHTLLYKTGSPTPTWAAKSAKEYLFLEWLCNGLAARMLLPSSLFREAAKNADFSRPDTIREVIDRASVSAETFIYRVLDDQSYFHSECGFGVCRLSANGLYIAALSLRADVAAWFGDGEAETFLINKLKESKLTLNGGVLRRQTIPVEVASPGGDRMQRSISVFSEVREKANANSHIFVLTLKD